MNDWVMTYSVFALSTGVFFLLLGMGSFFVNRKDSQERDMYKELLETVFKGIRDGKDD